MKKFIAIILYLLSTTVLNNVSAQTITVCGDVAGYSYWHKEGLVGDADAGWRKDKVDLTFSVVKTMNNHFDILIVDDKNRASSVVANSSTLQLVRRGSNDATLLRTASGGLIELYTIWKTSDGQTRVDVLRSVGASMLLQLSSVMTGVCTNTDFNQFNLN